MCVCISMCVGVYVCGRSTVVTGDEKKVYNCHLSG